MNQSLPSLTRQYEKHLSELEKVNRDKLETKLKKIDILKQELKLVSLHDWKSIKTKKKNQLRLIEDQMVIFRKRGLIKEGKAGRRPNAAAVPPIVTKYFKRQNCILNDLETIKRKQYEFYQGNLEKRIHKCEQRCRSLESQDQLIDFQMDTYPLLLQLRQTEKESAQPKPWCLEQSKPLALPPTKPPYHVLDEKRIYLTEQVKCDTDTPGEKPPAPKKTFLFAQPPKKPGRKTAASCSESSPLGYIRLLNSKLPAQDSSYCPECRLSVEWEKDERNGVGICQRCGFTRNMATSCKSSYYGMEIDYTEPFHYEKRNHFIDCLRQRQAKEECNIPRSVFNQVRAEIHRRQMSDPAALRPKHIRRILKALGLNAYYDHEIAIWWTVTGNKPPWFTSEQEKKLINMFDQSMEPYMKHKGKRNNYLTYSFAIHKMLEILGWPREIREFYPVLKSDSKRQDQELIFHKVCADLGWPILQTEQQFIDDAKY